MHSFMWGGWVVLKNLFRIGETESLPSFLNTSFLSEPELAIKLERVTKDRLRNTAQCTPPPSPPTSVLFKPDL